MNKNLGVLFSLLMVGCLNGSSGLFNKPCELFRQDFRYFRVGSDQSVLNEVLLGQITYHDVYGIYNSELRFLGLYRCLAVNLFMEIDSEMRTTPPRFLHVQTGEWFDVEKRSDNTFKVNYLSLLNQ